LSFWADLVMRERYGPPAFIMLPGLALAIAASKMRLRVKGRARDQVLQTP
jgi:hypothetical protein